MKLKDVGWFAALMLITLVIFLPPTRTLFESATTSQPYVMGFFKTAVLATMGEILVERIKTGTYLSNKGLVWKAFIWGLIGMLLVLIFRIFADGVLSAQENGLLPSIANDGFGKRLLTAFMTSLLMNLFFAPAFMIFHRFTDTFIDLGEGKLSAIVKVSFKDVVATIDWRHFFGFVVLKTIPFFWIPAHTVTFLLPDNYRVLMAAYLSLALGAFLTIAKTAPKRPNEDSSV